MRRILLAFVWGYAAWTWTAIGHFFFGLPDVGPVLAIIVGIAIVARPAARYRVADPRISRGTGITES